jgi:ribosomal peptide maturation radical SAM protein 1
MNYRFPTRRPSDGEMRILLVVPPFGPTTMPSLGPHTLQAMAARGGYQVDILYANYLLAARIGFEPYGKIVSADRELQVGTRLFAPHAFADVPSGKNGRTNDGGAQPAPQPLAQVADIEGEIPGFLEDVANIIRSANYTVVGCTTTFDQTQAALAILNRVKRDRPDIVTLLGGANCEGEMGEGLAEISPMVDYLFSGEAEYSFCSFLDGLKSGKAPSRRVIAGQPVQDLEAIPCPDFSQYFDQISSFASDLDPRQVWLSYETSRGCWWGQKNHCTFCGLNGSQMAFRCKSAAKVERELATLLEGSPTRKVCMADNIMPQRYHKSLVSQLAQWPRPPEIFYEVKGNLKLEQVVNLADAGIRTIQAGLESLSSRLLRLIKKGTTGVQNIQTLRYAQICGVRVIWNLLCGIPGETEADYRDMIGIIPWISHLAPPREVSLISFDRFSPYFQRPHEFGISNLRPLDAYRDVFPPQTKLAKVAYHFVGDYECCATLDSETMRRFYASVDAWIASHRCDVWRRPRLVVAPLNANEFRIIDARKQDRLKTMAATWEQAHAILFGRPGCESGVARWALKHGFALEIDGEFVPLAVADLETMQEIGEARADFRLGMGEQEPVFQPQA